MLTPLRQATARIVGVKQVLRALEEDKARTVFVALDADPFLTKRVMDGCYARNILCLEVPTAKEIGAACGIDVAAAAAAVLR